MEGATEVRGTDAKTPAADGVLIDASGGGGGDASGFTDVVRPADLAVAHDGAIAADSAPRHDAHGEGGPPVDDAAPADTGPLPDRAVSSDGAAAGDDAAAVPPPDAAVVPPPDAAALVPDAAPPPPPPPPNGQQTLDACLGETGLAERCTLVTNASACVQARCPRLVVIFSGGEQGCADGASYGAVLAGYAAHGYAAVCINSFDTPEGSGIAPYVDEAARIDLGVREATTGAWARAYWSGESLLFQGISHGATAPVILMARTNLDDQPHWHGSVLTAGCFFDGSYDQIATADLLRTGGLRGRPCLFPVSYTRGLERYCGPGATDDTCDLAAQPKVFADTITNVLPATLSIRDFRMFECGSALPVCVGDIFPGPPIEALCQRVEASPTHGCSFTSLPDEGHLSCHGAQYDQCRTWFEGLRP